MNPSKLHDASVRCPHCGHRIHLAIDASAGAQDYLDECRACGADIHLVMSVDEVFDKIVIRVRSDDENYY